MLLVRARAGVSAIHGLGLLAEQHIPAGTRVWEFRMGFDLMLTAAELERLSPVARDQVVWYGFWDANRGVFVLSMDDDRFTNHSPDPNTADASDYGSFAVRDIRPGEEITWDYRPWGGVHVGEKLDNLNQHGHQIREGHR